MVTTVVSDVKIPTTFSAINCISTATIMPYIVVMTVA